MSAEAQDSRDRAGNRERLLDAAERLFARHGVAETSVRTITTEAGMNVAAVNYYFESKDHLFEAVIDRRLPGLVEDREQGLERALAAGGEIEPLLAALIEPSIRLGLEQPTFMRLVSRLRFENDPFRWEAYRRRQSHLMGRFIEALCVALPHLEHREVAQRLQLVLGMLGHTLSSFPPDQEESGDQIVSRLVRFGAAGMRSGRG